MLLATSMVLSSVSVGTFADELIFEPEVSVTTEAGEDEAYFGDDVVTGDEQNEEDSAADETFFADEVIEDDQVNDDVIAEDVADDQEAYAFEEPIVDGNAFVGNEDVLEAIASEDAGYADEVTATGLLVAQDINETYSGQEYTINVTNGGETGTIVYADMATSTAPEEAPSAGDSKWTATVPTFKNVIDTYYYVGLMKDNNIIDITANPVHVVIAAKEVTAKVKDQTFVYRDLDEKLKQKITLDDIEFTGLVDGEDPATVLEINTAENAPFAKSNAVKTWADIDANLTEKTAVGRHPETISETAEIPAILAKANPKVGEAAATRNYTVKLQPNTFIAEITKLPVTLKIENASMEKGTAPNDKKYIKATVTDPAKFASYTVTLTGVNTSKLGKGTATVESISTGEGADADPLYIESIELNPETIEYEVTGKTLYIGIKPFATDDKDKPTDTAFKETVAYGTSKEDVFKTISISEKDLIYYTKNDAGVYTPELVGDQDKTYHFLLATDVRGTAQFETDYNQYDNVSPNEAPSYTIKYTGGLTSDNYTLAPAELNNKNLVVEPTAVSVTTEDIVVGVTEPPVELADQYIIKDGSLTKGEGDSAVTTVCKGAADALKYDIANGRIAVTMTTDPEKPSAVGSYPIIVTFEDKSSKKNVLLNNYVWKNTATNDFEADDRKYTVTSKEQKPKASGTGYDPVNRYTVAWGDFKMTFNDYEGKYDGEEHSIVIDPDPLPSTVLMYYGSKANWDAQKKKFDEATGDKADETRAEAVKAFVASATTNPTTRKEVGTTAVYYLATSTDYKTTADLAKWGTNNITILDGAEGDAKEVEKMIDEATKRDAEGKLDPEKVKEAEDAYNALSDEAKKEVSPASKKKLDDAVAEVKDDLDKKAAKEVEDAIDKLPAATEAKASDKEAADAAKEAYDKLTDDQKKLVPEDKVKKMNDVKAAADAAAEGDAKKAAKAVEDEIAALPDPEKATAADKAAADKAKADYDALSDEAKALVPAEAVDKMNAVKAAADQAAEKEKEAKEEVAALDEKVAAVKAAKNGADGKKAAEDAKAAYDALSDDAKALMTDEEQKAYDDTQEAYKKDKTFNSGEGVFRVLSNGEVTFLKPLHPENTWFVVPNMVKKNGFLYKVVKVSTKAFMGCVNATKIKIGKNVQSMGEYVFKNTPAMGKLIMLTSKLATGKVKNTFVAGGKDKGAKLTNYVPSGKSSAYDSLFKGEGGMNAKAKFTEEN